MIAHPSISPPEPRLSSHLPSSIPITPRSSQNNSTKSSSSNKSSAQLSPLELFDSSPAVPCATDDDKTALELQLPQLFLIMCPTDTTATHHWTSRLLQFKLKKSQCYFDQNATFSITQTTIHSSQGDRSVRVVRHKWKSPKERHTAYICVQHFCENYSVNLGDHPLEVLHLCVELQPVMYRGEVLYSILIKQGTQVFLSQKNFVTKQKLFSPTDKDKICSWKCTLSASDFCGVSHPRRHPDFRMPFQVGYCTINSAKYAGDKIKVTESGMAMFRVEARVALVRSNPKEESGDTAHSFSEHSQIASLKLTVAQLRKRVQQLEREKGNAETIDTKLESRSIQKDKEVSESEVEHHRQCYFRLVEEKDVYDGENEWTELDFLPASVVVEQTNGRV